MTGLLIKDIPSLTLSDVQADVREAIHWLTNSPTNDQECLRRNQTVVRLRQADWHITNALDEKKAA